MPPLSGFDRYIFLFQMKEHILYRLGFSIIVALDLAAAHSPQEIHLFLSLNALCKGLHADLLCHGYGGADYALGFFSKGI